MVATPFTLERSYSSLGEFTRFVQSDVRGNTHSFAQSRLTSGGVYRRYGIFRSSKLSIEARFRVGGEGNVPSADELVELQNRCREQSAAST